MARLTLQRRSTKPRITSKIPSLECRLVVCSRQSLYKSPKSYFCPPHFKCLFLLSTSIKWNKCLVLWSTTSLLLYLYMSLFFPDLDVEWPNSSSKTLFMSISSEEVIIFKCLLIVSFTWTVKKCLLFQESSISRRLQPYEQVLWTSLSSVFWEEERKTWNSTFCYFFGYVLIFSSSLLIFSLFASKLLISLIDL